ncbi:MAG TPA: class IV lanthionine synthetase LanL, partial [Micromonospora sp.]
MSKNWRAGVEEEFPLRELLLAVLADDAGDWRVRVAQPWCHVTPRAARPRLQGWKLHLSATPLSAPFVLVAAARVLVAEQCAFKFAATIGVVGQLSGGRWDRGGGGKFVTVYPRDDEQFRLLAEELHLATDGLPGPAIMSDRRYRPTSPVHYRFGAFTGVNRLNNDGGYENMLTAPDGTLVADQRRAWFTVPEWAGNPFPDSVDAVRTRARPAAVLLNDRFEVRRAIQHANKGGVFQAYDRDTGDTVVVKQARPHTQSALTGTDGRDVLRHEARMLTRLAPTGLAPRLVDLFEQGGDLFLAEEHLPGQPLRGWVHEQVRSGGIPVPAALAVARQLVELVDAVHGCGLVIRDLSPNNLLVSPSGRLRMVDLEFVDEPGVGTRRVHTPGYGAPEVEQAPRFGPAPDVTADLYSLGATLFQLATGADPVLLADRPPSGRDEQDRLATLTTRAATELPALRALAPAVLGLTRRDPAARWALAQVTAYLDGLATSPADAADPTPATPAVTTGRGAGPVPGSSTPDGSPVSVDRALTDGLRALLGLIDTTGGREVARSSAFGALTDRCNVQHGAAGLLAVLCRARSAGVGAVPEETVAALARWLADRLPDEPRTLPGL